MFDLLVPYSELLGRPKKLSFDAVFRVRISSTFSILRPKSYLDLWGKTLLRPVPIINQELAKGRSTDVEV